jgi:hypothetical protein
MQFLWLFLIPVIMWLWAVSVPLTLNMLYGKNTWFYDCWWRGPTYFVFNICTAFIGIAGIVVCFVKAFE